MKSRILITVAAVVAMFVSSCQDATNIEQPGSRNDDALVFRTADDIERGVLGLYASFPAESEIDFVSFFTDEIAVGEGNGGQGVNSGEWRFFMDGGNGFAASTWRSYYNIINRVNRLLVRSDELIAEGGDEVSLNLSKANMRAIRAYANMKLFAYFTPDYTNPNGMSVIKLDFLQTDDYERYEERASVQEIVSFIEEDVEYVMNSSISDNAVGSENNVYVSKAFAQAVLARLYSMTENLPKLNEALTSSELSAYSLANVAQYSMMFGQDNTLLDGIPEIIFRLKRTNQDGNRVASAWYATRVDPRYGGVYMEIGRNLYNELDMLDPDNQGKAATITRDDMRYSVNVLSSSSPRSNYQNLTYENYLDTDLLYIGKYPGNANDPLQNDIQIFRHAEMLLLKAEYFVMNGQWAEVEGVIQELRNTRSRTQVAKSMPVITNEQSAWKAILDERQIEFAFEGHRYLDVKRLGLKAGLTEFFVRDNMDCLEYNACSLPLNEAHKLTLPIPRTELQANPAIRDQQNPGY